MVQYDVVLSEPAETDLNGVADYISVQLSSPMSAINIVEAIENTVMGLSHMPHRHALVDDKRLAALGYRMVPIKNFIAFFTVDEDSKIVSIERILYGRRDWLHIL